MCSFPVFISLTSSVAGYSLFFLILETIKIRFMRDSYLFDMRFWTDDDDDDGGEYVIIGCMLTSFCFLFLFGLFEPMGVSS